MESRYSRYYLYIKPVLRNQVIRTYSSLVFSLIAVTIFILFAIRPTISTILTLQKTISGQQILLEKLEIKEQDLALARKNYQTQLTDQTKIKLNKLLPSYTSLPSLIDSLNSVASQSQASLSGIQIQSITLTGKPDVLSATPNLSEVEFNFSVSGSYPNLINFLGGLSRSERLITINSLGLAKREGGVLVLTISAKSYYFKN